MKERMKPVPLGEIALCAIVEAELRFGAEKSGNPRGNLLILEDFVDRFVVLPFDSAAAREYGALRAHLERTGDIIGRNDLLIASISRVPRLRVEDWEAQLAPGATGADR